MKYENFNKAAEIVNSIRNIEGHLNNLNGGDINVRIAATNYHFMTIGTGKSYEHECSTLAKGFICDLKHHYEQRIKQLKAELELL
jgi:hypothetical protein